jgi:hypothetical protein
MDFWLVSIEHILHSHVLLFFPSTNYSGFLGSNGSVIWYDLIFWIDFILVCSSWNLWVFPVLVEVLIFYNIH